MLDRVEQSEIIEPRNGNGNGSARAPRKYVLFADGTGNAFSTQESNVWRLYEALDRTQADQVAYYIKGVGTSGFGLWAKLDGATGIGVPANVRKLYRFLCWNWRPGDEIYIFGFSRGAFTARTLAALIASQGLVPAKIDGKAVSHAEMERNTMAAWRKYRRSTVPWYMSLPSIWISRWIRDFFLMIFHFVMRHRSYKDVRAEMEPSRANVTITFLGLFDTVEAYGVPVEELRTAIDWAIWPISFRNRMLSHKVERARHALALDDERTTFHPLRFDQSKLRTPDQVKEVWFAGVHSDVGGGYPDGNLAYVPLMWMVDELGGSLRFQDEKLAQLRAYQSALGPAHDSRSGTGSFYRYGPRPIGIDPQVDGGPPVVHMSVVERMLQGCDNYAPVTLPASAKVLMPDGSVMPLVDESTRAEIKSAVEASASARSGTGLPAAPAKLAAPDDNMVQQALDTVWWRRVVYFTLLALVAFAIAWPWTAETVVGWFIGPASELIVDGDKTSALDIIRTIDYGVGAVVGSTANFLQGLSPSYLAPWFRIAIFYPFATSLVVLAVIVAWTTNGFLRDRINERARLAWNRPDRKTARIDKPSVLLKLARWMRQNAKPVQIAVSKVLLPSVFLVLIFTLAFVAVGRSAFNWYAGTGAMCTTPGGAVDVTEQGATAPRKFDTASMCWASGLQVEKGRNYRIWIKIEEPWFDRSFMAGANGFDRASGAHLVALPLRRWVTGGAWFQPVLRVGKEGVEEIALTELNGLNADKLPRERFDANGRKQTLPSRLEDIKAYKGKKEFGIFETIPAEDVAAARDVWRRQGLAGVMVADFVAPASGEVFLYVNDAVQVLPLLGHYGRYYQNNSGTAEVKLQREPLPPAPGR
jgi:uncharacterized protein (DUF2235 family)